MNNIILIQTGEIVSGTGFRYLPVVAAETVLNPFPGQIIYNITTSRVEIYDGDEWVAYKGIV